MAITFTNYAAAIATLKPGASFSMGDVNDFTTLVWLDTVQVAPTKAQADAQLATLQTTQTNKVASKASYAADPNFQSMLAQLDNATAAQIATFVNTNVTDIATAKTLLIKILLILGTLV